eukprot:5987004-Alexandrium_andersonii.AAC.1
MELVRPAPRCSSRREQPRAVAGQIRPQLKHALVFLLLRTCPPADFRDHLIKLAPVSPRQAIVDIAEHAR